MLEILASGDGNRPLSFLDEKYFLEDVITINTMHRDIEMAIDTLMLEEVFMEDGDDDADTQKTSGLADKIHEKIQKLLDFIHTIIDRVKRLITGVGKKRLSADDYLNSGKGSAELNQRYGQIMKEVDEAFLEMRPIIQQISKGTGMDARLVEKLCDGVNKKLANRNWRNDIMTIVRKGEAYHIKQTEKYADECAKWDRIFKRSNSELHASKKRIKDKERQLRALDSATATYGKFMAKLFGGSKKEAV